MKRLLAITLLTACTADHDAHTDAPLCDTFASDLTYLTVYPTRTCAVSLADIDYLVFTSSIPGTHDDPHALFISAHDPQGHQEQVGTDTKIGDDSYSVWATTWHGETGKAVVLDIGNGMVERCQWVKCAP